MQTTNFLQIAPVPGESDEIRIDKGIPIPARRAGRLARYPWRAMEVGDSFFAPIPDTEDGKRGDAPLRGATVEAGRRLGVKFSARIVTESGIRGLRVWRVE